MHKLQTISLSMFIQYAFFNIYHASRLTFSHLPHYYLCLQVAITLALVECHFPAFYL